jgi:hypothetical protein
MKSLMQHFVFNKTKNEIYIQDNNYFEGEPVGTPYGEGYIMKDYINDFKIEENATEGNEKEKKDNNENEEETNEKENQENEEETSEKENQENEEFINQNKNEIKEENNDNKKIKNGLVEIKFDFGKGRVYTKNITKQIQNKF